MDRVVHLRWCDRAFTCNCTAHELSTSVVTKLLSFFLATFLGVFKADSRPRYSFNLDNFRSEKENGFFWPSGEQADFRMWLTLPTSAARSCVNFELQDGNTYGQIAGKLGQWPTLKFWTQAIINDIFIIAKYETNSRNSYLTISV